MYSEKRKAVLGVNITFFVLSWITVGLRVLVRTRMLQSFGRDDWTMLATQVFFTIYLSCQLGGVVYGTGQHLSDLEESRATKALHYWYFCEVFYVLATVTMKISIGFFLLRVAIKPIYRWTIWAIMGISVVFGGAFTFVLIFQCWPISDWWSLDPTQKKCINPEIVMGLTYGISGLNVLADWTVGILPIFIVRDLQMSARQKRLVSIILSFAALGSAATIVRLPYIGPLKESFAGRNGDFLYDTVGVAIWTTVEIGVGISAGCVATLRPLLRWALDHLGIGQSSTGGRHSSHHIFGRKRRTQSGLGPSLPLDGLQAGHGIVTTITGNRGFAEKSQRSRSSSQEELAFGNDITKQVVVEFDELDAEYGREQHVR